MDKILPEFPITQIITTRDTKFPANRSRIGIVPLAIPYQVPQHVHLCSAFVENSGIHRHLCHEFKLAWNDAEHALILVFGRCRLFRTVFVTFVNKSNLIMRIALRFFSIR